jgi:hypothetical protein
MILPPIMGARARMSDCRFCFGPSFKLLAHTPMLLAPGLEFFVASWVIHGKCLNACEAEVLCFDF